MMLLLLKLCLVLLLEVLLDKTREAINDARGLSGLAANQLLGARRCVLGCNSGGSGGGSGEAVICAGNRQAGQVDEVIW